MESRSSHFGRSALIVLFSIFDLTYCNCPDLCDPCFNAHLMCINPGLTEIPSNIETTIQKVTIQKQTFLSTDLGNANFSSFIGIIQLSIRSSNINKILPYTFSNLTLLQQLDLSDNAELIVKENAFHGLNLNILKLDNMGMITLAQDAFQGLTVRSLSIQNSNLLTLPVKLMQPVANSISKLFLKNNQLRTLDPQLKIIFQKLEILELQKNPFICNCSIAWLSKLLHLTFATASNENQQTFDSSAELYPSCVSPSELRKKFLHEITSKLSSCSPPNIIRIDVSFESYSAAVIDCFVDSVKDVHQQTVVGWLPNNEVVTDVKQLKRTMTVTRHVGNSNYLCRAINANGNSEIVFHIDWLQSTKDIDLTVVTPASPTNNSSANHSILWRSVFSLFEMICAIVGTLIITMIIFLVFCCCHRCRLHIPFLEKDGKFNCATPPIYERGVFKDEGRYCETEIDVRLFPPPPPTPPPFPDNMMMMGNYGK